MMIIDKNYGDSIEGSNCGSGDTYSAQDSSISPKLIRNAQGKKNATSVQVLRKASLKKPRAFGGQHNTSYNQFKAGSVPLNNQSPVGFRN
jgi:hypothetical protein